jgi:protein gp37
MQKSGIDYLTHTWNFQTGCLNQENGVCTLPCWAKGMAHRFYRSFKPELHVEKLAEAIHAKLGDRVGVCFTGDLFGGWVNPDAPISYSHLFDAEIPLKHAVLQIVQHSDAQFFFLTKCPWNLLKWGAFPDNAWVGASVCNRKMLAQAVEYLANVEAAHKWLSIEPLMEPLVVLDEPGNCFTRRALREQLQQAGIDWIVIGGQTQPLKLPEPAWVKEITDAADAAGIPYWLKNNLSSLFPNIGDGQSLPYKAPGGEELVLQLDRVMTEKELSQQVQQLARLKGYRVYHTFLSVYSEPGFPDLCMAKEGRLIFAELKTERGKVTSSQKDWLEVLAASKACEVYIWRPGDWDEIVKVLV